MTQKNQRELYLIGTTHASNLLAKRTQELVKKVKPDALYVQTNEKWWQLVKDLKGIKSQADLDAHNGILRTANDWYVENNFRGVVFKFRWYTWLISMMQLFKLRSDFHPFTPGLEMKFAIEEGVKANAKIVYGGLETNAETLASLQIEKRMDFVPMLIKSWGALHNKLWKTEHLDTYRLLDVQGSENFAELIDRHRTNWFIKLFEKYAPWQKRIFIDQKDIDLFTDIYRLKGKKIVAVVNQWHTPGIEAHWRHTTDTELKEEPINPIGDMDINEYMEQDLINTKLREIVSQITQSEPATWQNYITQYHKETQEAHRSRHVFFLGYDDPNIHHGLFGHHGAEDHHFSIDPYHGKYEKRPHLMVMGGGVQADNEGDHHASHGEKKSEGKHGGDHGGKHGGDHGGKHH